LGSISHIAGLTTTSFTGNLVMHFTWFGILVQKTQKCSYMVCFIRIPPWLLESISQWKSHCRIGVDGRPLIPWGGLQLEGNGVNKIKNKIIINSSRITKAKKDYTESNLNSDESPSTNDQTKKDFKLIFE
jgi:hypothetical protein